jgi:hypothetical protein
VGRVGEGGASIPVKVTPTPAPSPRGGGKKNHRSASERFF